MGRFAIKAGQRTQRFRTKLGNIAYAANQTPGISPTGVNKSGYVTGFDLRSLQQIVVGASAPVLANYGAYGPLGRIQIVIGPNYPISMPGWFAERFYEAYDAPYTDARVASGIGTNATTTWVNDLRIPLTVDPQTEYGAWFLGDPEFNMDLQIFCNPIATVASTVNGATLQGSWDVWVERFSSPFPHQPGGWLNEISYYHESKFFVTKPLLNGDQPIDLPRDRDLIRVFGVLYTGSDQDSTFAPADGLYNNVTLLVNDETYVYNRVDEAVIKQEMLRNYTRQLAAGVMCLDLWNSPGRDRNSRRDVLPTDSSLASSVKLVVNSGSSSNSIDVYLQTMSDNPYAVKWIQAAGKGKQAA